MISSPCTILKGVGAKLSERLKSLNITTIQDILFHLPSRYEDRSQIKKIRSIQSGDAALVEGTVVSWQMQYGQRRSFVINIEDGSGVLRLRLFYFSSAQIQNLSQEGLKIRCFGTVKFFGRALEMVHPEYKVLEPDEDLPLKNELTPIYPSVNGVSQKIIQKLTSQALQRIAPHKNDIELIPESVLKELNLPTVFEALQMIHCLPVDADSTLHVNRLAFEELLAHQLSLRKARVKQQTHSAYLIEEGARLVPELIKNLPFSLTGAQKRVIDEINQDLSSGRPMLRLLQGDVGSGKTIVAAIAILSAVEAGKQAAIMAPTEILAEQHYHNFSQWFERFGVNVEWLSGSVRGKTREETLSKLQNGAAQVVIGTHALFQEDVHFFELGLIVIDEQHRFGVNQRLAFYEKGKCNDVVPHQLVMSATPIPRTLTMTAYADLDCSVIDELPAGRMPIGTIMVDNQRREEVIARVQSHCEESHQVYWVCTLIDESDVLECQAAEKSAEILDQLLPGLKVALIHGRMKPAEKEAVMSAFKKGESDVLVATTVIEVGVDVPNATLMVIENPERLGLSQLHQLRGRVGRGQKKSFCVLLYQSPLSASARERLNIMRETQDGFEIARKDLEIRGPGEVLGTRQAGAMMFRIADLLRDQALIPQVQRAAALILTQYPECLDPIMNRWLRLDHQYSEV